MFRPVHFEIHAENTERAMQFYTDIFGWRFSKFGDHDYWSVVTGEDNQPGINGGLMKRLHPAGATYNTIDVPSVDEFMAKIIANGGSEALPKYPIPGIGWVAYAKDTEGNIFGVYQHDPSAK